MIVRFLKKLFYPRKTRKYHFKMKVSQNYAVSYAFKIISVAFIGGILLWSRPPKIPDCA